MGKDWKVKETETERIQRWLDTPKDAFGLFTGVPNQVPIDHKHAYYGEINRVEYNTRVAKQKRASRAAAEQR